jgi:hypothetical protein
MDEEEYIPEFDCRLQFDYLFKCLSIPDQLNALYRNGELPSCRLWIDKFKWCLGAQFKSDEDRRVNSVFNL